MTPVVAPTRPFHRQQSGDMSRHLRSALTVAAQVAGPSSHRLASLPLRSIPSPLHRPVPAFTQTRSISFGSLPLPSWMLRHRQREQDETVEEESVEKDESKEGEDQNEDSSVTDSIFSTVTKEFVEANRTYRWRGPREHRYKTAKHKISSRKLNDLGKQIAGLPIDEAILQMQFSEKGAAKWVKSTLALARDQAEVKGLQRSKLKIEAAWVCKAPYRGKTLDIKGRGRHGIRRHPFSRLHLLLKEGKTRAELAERRFIKDLNKVRSAGVVREDGKLRRQHVKDWAW